MSQPPSRRGKKLHIETLENREVPAVLVSENFDTTAPGSLPAGWDQWSNVGMFSYALSQTKAASGSSSLATSGTSTTTARFWRQSVLPADTSIAASVFVDSLIPIQLFARGSQLDTTSPTFYALTITRGLSIEISRVVNGQSTSLGTLKTPAWFSSQWVRASLVVDGTQLKAQIQRMDTNQYLHSNGLWQTAETTALTVNDSVISSGGQLGLNRQAKFSGNVFIDDLTLIGKGEMRETFDTTANGALPPGWMSWASDGLSNFGASTVRSLSPTKGLTSNITASNIATRAWVSDVAPADSQVEAAFFANTLIPAQLFLRGKNLDTATPSYYGVTILRGLSLTVTRTVDGVTTPLGTIQSKSYFSSKWVKVSLSAASDRLRVFAQRTDTNQYLNSAGEWQDTPTFAMEVRDTTISTAGQAGVARTSGYTGTVTFDDFRLTSSAGDTIAPTLQITAPSTNGSVSGLITVRASAQDAGGISKVEFVLNGVVRFVQITGAPFEWQFNTQNESNGSHTLTVRAYDNEGNVGTISQTMVINNSTPSPALPTVPRHYSHIRIAQLAYSGNPLGTFERDLLRDSVDLVIPNPIYLSTINSVAPNTPQLIYTNVSNLYLDLLQDWLNYADRNNVSRGLAFFHASQATPWTGNSPSSQPVNWFWNVQRGSATPTNWTTGFTNRTSQARGTQNVGTVIGGVGQATYIGYLEKFREINVTIGRAASGNWAGVVEYASAVDANGNPTQWKTLTPVTNTTNNWRNSGQLTFNPPSDWKAVSIAGAKPMYYVRVRATVGTEAQSPMATRILGRDYAQANGGTTGTTPAFDSIADKDRDGYLNDAEFAARRTGFNARFVYESRIFYPVYGQMRFVTNLAPVPVEMFFAEYNTTLLNSQPLADGLFVDNSGGKLPIPNTPVLEQTATYAKDYGATLSAIGRAINPRWVIANTVGGGTAADEVAKYVPATIEEFLLRPLAATWSQFLDVADLVKRRQSVSNPTPYLVLDSMPTGGNVNDPRTQLATLAYYYMVGNPDSTFLMFYGGFEPSSTWTRHWSNYVKYDVGKPVSDYREMASGIDPANGELTYKVYGREYTNSLVLYKPLSYTLGKGTGTTVSLTATTMNLNGNYRVVDANGVASGPVINRITLKNGEGVILAKA